MTTDNTQPSVLILGRSQLVVDDAAARLRDLGYSADGTNDFLGDVTGRFDPNRLDLVVFGGQVSPDRKAELQAEIGAINRQVTFLQGLAGIPGLIVDQVQQALGGEHLIPGQAPIFDPAQRAIVLSTFAPLDATVTTYWTTEMVPPDPKSDSRILFDGPLPAGEHTFALPEEINLDRAFATVRAAEARWSFRLLTPTESRIHEGPEP